MRGHYEGDPAAYRPKEVTEEWGKRDPIDTFRAYLLKDGIDEKEITAIDDAMEKEIDDAIQFSLDSPLPDVSEVTTDVYSSDNERCVAR